MTNFLPQKSFLEPSVNLLDTFLAKHNEDRGLADRLHVQREIEERELQRISRHSFPVCKKVRLAPARPSNPMSRDRKFCNEAGIDMKEEEIEAMFAVVKA